MMAAETEAPVTPEVLEAGRYKLTQDPAGGWHIGRAVGTCERCQSCGCGEQADVIHVPAMFIALARQGGGMSALKAKLGGVMGRGRADGS
jgi:hypothetical protein